MSYIRVHRLLIIHVNGKEGNGKRKRKAETKTKTEGGNGKRKKEILSQLCKVNDHYHSVFCDMNMTEQKVES